MRFIFTKVWPAVFWCAGLVIAVQANGQIINTVAGGGIDTIPGMFGDNGLATSDSAYLQLPQGVAVDKADNIFIADTKNDRVREVSAFTGIITTYAGGGTSLGDGGLAVNAQISMPTGIALDDSGNVYIIDNGNDRVRKITNVTGIINTIAGDGSQGSVGDGGPATSAEFFNPLGIALDDSGNVYIADEGNNRIRKIEKSTGIINTVAGNGSLGSGGDGGQATLAQLRQPTGVAVDTAGNIYIADCFNYRIRKVNKSTGIINTIAGNGTANYSGDGQQAINAKFNLPMDIALDDSGNIYISDYFNAAVRKISVATGVITSYAGYPHAGHGVSGFAGDGGLADSALLDEPTGLAIDACNNLFIAEEGNARIREVSVNFSPASYLKTSSYKICRGDSVTFSDSSNFKPTNWNWSFPGGVPDTSNAKTPTVAYSAPGKYNITLTAWNHCSTTSETYYQYVKVNVPGVLNILPHLPAVCAGQSVPLYVESGTQFTWSPATGLNATTGDTVMATPSATITYTVTGTDTGNCVTTGTDILTIITPPVGTFTDTTTGNRQVSFNSAGSTGVTGYSWNFDDQTPLSTQANPVHTFGAGVDSFNVCLTVFNSTNCSFTYCKIISVLNTGVEQVSGGSEQLSIYPNPVSKQLAVAIGEASGLAPGESRNEIEILDMLGRTLLVQKATGNLSTIDVSNLAAGAYLVEVKNKTGIEVKKFVKE